MDKKRLRAIFEKTDGRCHICHKGISWKNYGRSGQRGGWEVDHSVPRARGGSDHGANLYPAHIACNRRKRDGSTATARARHGKKRAPLSAAARRERRTGNSVAGGLVGVAVGHVARAALGPAGWLIGGLIGVAVGASVDPEE